MGRGACPHRVWNSTQGGRVEQLLAHRSGIGDYLDEDEQDDNNDYVLAVPVHELATTEQFLAVLDGHPMKYEPGERCAGRRA